MTVTEGTNVIVGLDVEKIGRESTPSWRAAASRACARGVGRSCGRANRRGDPAPAGRRSAAAHRGGAGVSDYGTRPIANWVRHEQALVALRWTLAALEEARVPVLVVKGMVLAYSLYDDVAERPLSDVDLRIRPRDFFRVLRAMRARGLEAHWESRQLGAVSFLLGGTLVEFETSVGPPGLCALSVGRMMERAQERALGGGLRVQEPELHDHAVLLVVNAFKDKMVDCPKWSMDDLDTIAKRVDPDMFLARIEEARLTAVTWFVADWLAGERQSASWGSIRDRLGSQSSRRASRLRTLFKAHRGSFAARVLARIASDSPAQRAWSLAAASAGTAVWWLARRF